ncbi:lysophospholipid acyltransferase family protein [Leyella stercorea]|uniref:lysophospholipid acyltransferase family protein n=1 Tax=Leyella stercorea TaxID=363265 RepID=UPI00242DB7A6|nr:lysophospholipid acyltransferase family protein [Leyella stercorea]
MKYIYRTYQLLIALPLIAIYTLITCLMVTVGCALGNGHFWGYYPGKWWAQFIIRILLLPVKVEGRENLVKGQSYVFVANHQGAFDIFLIYGFLSRNFKWMMKRQLRQMPFVGKACESAHHIFVDKRGASKIRETYDRARQTLQGGMSLVVFPEGARSFTGHMGVFKRGAFMLADDIELPVVPLTINGSFDIMPRTRDMKWVVWHPLRLTIHKPIQPVGKGTDNIKYLEQESYKVVMGGLEEKYQGFVENPDQ